jgi:hypothetical protein
LNLGKNLYQKGSVFDTHPSLLIFPEQAGYRLVSKPVSKTKYQNLTYAVSFDTSETP